MTDEVKALDPNTVRVVFVGDNGITEKMDTWIEGEYLCFKTSHFSTFAVTGKMADLSKNDGGNTGSVIAPDGNGAGVGVGSSQSSGDSIAKTGDGSGLTVALLGFGALVAAGAVAVVRRRMGQAE